MALPIGPCRLCGKTRELHDSHIVPAWCFERARHGPEGRQSHLVLLDGKTESAVYSSRQFSEHLLCKPCEDIFSGPENYVSTLLFQEDGSFPLLDQLPGGEAERVVPLPPSVDVEALTHFAYGVVWRGSVCSDLKPRLGPYEKRFADYLLGNAGVPGDTCAIIKVITDPRLQRGLIPPQIERAGGCYRHSFTICGAVFMIFVGQLVTPALRLVHFPLTRVVLVGDGREILDVSGPLFRYAPKGKLARDRKAGRV